MRYSLLSLSVLLFWSSALPPLLAQVYSFQKAFPVQAPRFFAPQDSLADRKPPLLHISPDDANRVWKKDAQKAPANILKSTPSAGQLKSPAVIRWLPESEKNAREAASIDPGILYNPPEKQQPAGIVIKPLRDIDPQMTFDPGPGLSVNPPVEITVRPAPEKKKD